MRFKREGFERRMEVRDGVGGVSGACSVVVFVFSWRRRHAAEKEKMKVKRKSKEKKKKAREEGATVF